MIRLKNVSKSYPASTRPALAGVDLEIEDGEFVFLIGASGSGKSTLIRLLISEEPVTSGTIRVGDFRVDDLPRRKLAALRQSVGVVFQDFRLLSDRTVAENVDFALQVIGTRKSERGPRVAEALRLVGLDGKTDRLPAELSGGEQQRVAIARAWVNRPRVLLADEPTGNLDPDTADGIVTLLDRINREGTTVIMATHDDHIVDALRRRVVELKLGKVVRDEAHGVYGIGR